MRKVDKKFLQEHSKEKLSDLALHEIGKLNQKRVKTHYEKQGYHVLDVTEEGFPDLIVILDNNALRKIMFVEAKGGDHEVHWSQTFKLFELSKLGSKVKIGHVIDHLDEKKWKIVEEEPPYLELVKNQT